MEIIRKDIEQALDIDDLLYDLIRKYYPVYDKDSFGDLDEVTQTFILIIDADGQINNGGIIQFIDNGTGDRFHETLEAAHKINSKILLDLLTQAAQQFPNGQIPKDEDERRRMHDALCEKHTTSKTFDELSSDEKQIVLETRARFGDTTPLNQCRYEQKSSWSAAWDELDRLYYNNTKVIYMQFIEYLKSNATLVD